LLRTAKWRKDVATPGQIEFLSKRRSRILQDSRASVGFDDNDSSAGNKENVGSPNYTKLTKGQAANLITRIKHGAQVSVGQLSVYDIGQY